MPENPVTQPVAQTAVQSTGSPAKVEEVKDTTPEEHEVLTEAMESLHEGDVVNDLKIGKRYITHTNGAHQHVVTDVAIVRKHAKEIGLTK